MGRTADLRKKLFDSYSKNFTFYKPEEVELPEGQDIFVCPLCMNGFTREALAEPDPAVSLPHVVPESLGGKFCTLTCTRCNNAGGSNLEAYLVAHVFDDLKGTSSFGLKLRPACGVGSGG